MTFKKKPPKPPKATLDDLLQSGAVKTGKQVAEDRGSYPKLGKENNDEFSKLPMRFII